MSSLALTDIEIPGYRLISRLGSGAQASVFKAEQISMSRPVAIKIIPPSEERRETDHARFLREARVLARLRHENIVRAIDYGEHKGVRYLVMEFIEGTSVHEMIGSEGALGVRRSIEIVIQICRALGHAAEFGVIHRDIKPANVVITGEGRAVLVDFGLARSEGLDAQVTIAGMTLGTPHYMPPEQIKGEDKIDLRADIYALGGTFFHMLTGQAPFPWQSRPEIMAAHLREDVQLPADLPEEIPDNVFGIVQKAMEKSREERYRSAREMVSDLVAAVEQIVPNGMDTVAVGFELIEEVSERARRGASLKERIASLSVEKKRLAREKAEVDEQLGRLRKKSREASEQAREEISNALREKQAAEERLAAYSVDLRSTLDRLEALEDTVRDRDQEAEALESRAVVAEERVRALESLVEGLETDHSPAGVGQGAEKEADLRRSLAEAVAERDRLRGAMLGTERMVESLSRAELERDRTAAREASLRTAIEEIRSSSMQDQARNQAELENLSIERDELRKRSSDLEQQLETLKRVQRQDDCSDGSSGEDRSHPEVEALRRQVRDIEKQLGLRNAEALVSSEAHEAALTEKVRLLDEAARDRGRLEQQIAELTDSVALLESERNGAESGVEDAGIEILIEERDRLDRRVSELDRALTATEEECREAEARAATADREREEATRAAASEKALAQEESFDDLEMEELIARFRESAMSGNEEGGAPFGVDDAERIAAYTLRRMDTLKSDLAAIETAREDERDNNRAEIKKLASEGQKLKSDRRKMQSDMERLTKELESALSERRKVAREKVETDGKLKRLTAEIVNDRKRWAREREKIEASIKELRRERETAVADMAEFRRRWRLERIRAAMFLRRLRSEIADLQSEASLLRAENRALQSDREEIAAMISESIVVSDFLDSEILSVPQEEDEAIESTTAASTAPPPDYDEGLLLEADEPAERETTRMAYVSRGVFVAGEETGAHVEKPRRELELPAYWIDIHPVTNRQFAQFLAATGRVAPDYWKGSEPPEEILDHPVVWVSFHDCSAYAVWAGKRLPTPHEWQKAARGTDGRAYPWGNEVDVSRLNCRETGFFRTTGVRQFRTGVSPYGVYDMAGNVVEWVSGKYAARGPDGTPRVTRAACGGSWRDPLERSMCASRRGYPDQGRGGHVGFRCVRDASS